MRKTIAVLLLVAFAAIPIPTRAVTIDWSPVGNPGNAADTAVAYDGTTGYGAVPYAYSIGTYDVTNAQYAEFLNTKDPTGANTLGLWSNNMADPMWGGINFNTGNSNGSKYTLVAGRQSHPVNFVTWYDAIRFANWLNNGQGSGDTESGAYTLLGGTPTPFNGLSITRNSGATVFLPSENEWYKAAFYDPRTTAQGGPPLDSHYWQYPTSTNDTPIASGPTAVPNSANYNYAVGNITDVGAYTGTTSPYGAFDMGGNVWQWDEALISGVFRELRGGGYFTGSSMLGSGQRGGTFPDTDVYTISFRVATVIPEPSSLILAALGFVGLAAWGWRRRIGRTN